MVYTITLNPALDYELWVDDLRYDDINRASAESLHYGGKGINVSVILSRLGVANEALGFTAGFTGEQLKTILRAEGIRCDFTDLSRGMTRINVKIRADIELDVNARGPEISEREIEDLLAKLDKAAKGDFVVIAGSVPKNLPPDIYERMLRQLDGRGVRFVVDTTGALLLGSLKYKPFLIKPNHHELGDLFGVRTETEEDIVFYARKLRERGARNVLVSRAGDGALLVDENDKVHTVGVVPGKAVSSVGCGDSMVGGFIAGYLQKGDYEYALRLGAACGSATAFTEGLADRRDIDEVFDKLK